MGLACPQPKHRFWAVWDRGCGDSSAGATTESSALPASGVSSGIPTGYAEMDFGCIFSFVAVALFRLKTTPVL